jgi:hypothetical protein
MSADRYWRGWCGVCVDACACCGCLCVVPVSEQRLAKLLAQQAHEPAGGSRRQVHLSGLRAQPGTATVQAAARTPSLQTAARKPRAEHGSNSLFKTLTAAPHPLSVRLSPSTAAGPAHVRAARVEHGSNLLLRVLSGQTGTPSHSSHDNTLLYHASRAKGPKQALAAAVSPASARKAAVSRGSAVAQGVHGVAHADARAQLQDGLKKKAQSWFWPFF